ncbi:hypothetical protein [Actinoplanes teichomyceticus]|uniref:Cytochrome C biogenesis protein transmembrane region n=1 Tax=Actinoplanes teichomyceticus TaxID=1867 RepID=A0A561WBW5_ACTTI|nr:hypothetical protein [Actinoplanes teichomyceticus]TWG21354.1 hypothetical protein FHX34_103892 [Actinoplanes teichomyceticus]GIF16439.1 hypothetical protein Ate01nite_64710 [Actinoplanes teichomyceticus]
MSATPELAIHAAEPVSRRRTGRVALLSVAAGVLLAVLWSFEFVDHTIGDTVANALLGRDAKATAIGGALAGLVFAFVSGLAGTFTACNVAVMASIGPMGHAGSGARRLVHAALRPIGWLALGMVSVSAVYGFAGVLIGDALPQLSTATAAGMPVRLLQSVIVFGVIGLAFAYLGLASLGFVPDPFATRPTARVITLGALVGGFLIGRPYPLFNELFHWAADRGNPLYGAAAFVLQSLGNIVVVSALFLLLMLGTRGRFLTWLGSDRQRTLVISGAMLLALGVFEVVYWDVRVPALFGHGWFPTMPYNE